MTEQFSKDCLYDAESDNGRKFTKGRFEMIDAYGDVWLEFDVKQHGFKRACFAPHLVRAALAAPKKAEAELVHHGVVVRVGQVWITVNKIYPTVTLREVRASDRYVRFDSAYNPGGLDGASVRILQDLVSDVGAEPHSPAPSPPVPQPPEPKRDPYQRSDGLSEQYIAAMQSNADRIRKQKQALEQLSRPLPSAHPKAWPSDCDSEELYVS